MDNLYEALKNLNIFIENEYFKSYVQLINSNKNTKQKSFKTQKHHIIPQYYFKNNNVAVDNSKANIVNLQYKDHVLAHYYLINCCKNDSDVLSNIHAFNILLRKQGHRLSEIDLKKYLDLAAQFEQKRLLHLLNIGKLKNTGGKYVYKDNIVKHIKEYEVDTYLAAGWELGNPNAAHKDKSKKYCITNEVIFKRVKQDELNKYLELGWRLGTPKATNETKQKMSISLKGHRCNTKNKIVVTNGKINKFIYKEELDNYLADGWLLGSKPRKEEFKKQAGNRSRGRIHINNGQSSKMVLESELQNYLDAGWVRGRLWKKKKR